MSLSHSEEERYARHFSLAEVGRCGQEKLKAAKVLIIGAGGLGSPISLYLAAAGIGHIAIADADRVSLSNLQRQILFSSADVSALKVEKAKEHLLALNPDIVVETHCVSVTAQNARELVRVYDLVIDGTDNFATRYCVNDACVLENKPLIFGALYKFEAQISVLHWNEGPCYRCLYPTPPPAEAIPNCSETGVLGVLPGTTGTLMATEALKLILGIGKPLSGQLLIYDSLNMNFFRRKLERNKECPACGVHPQITSLAAHMSVADEGLEWNALETLLEQFDPFDRNFILIDVRGQDEFAQISLKNSKNIPLAELSSSLQSYLPEWKSSSVIFICHSGKRSARAVEILREAGLSNVQHVRGGLLGRSTDYFLS